LARLRTAALAFVILVLGAAGCGGGDEQPAPQQAAEEAGPTPSPPPAEMTHDSGTGRTETQAKTTTASDAALARRPAGAEGLRVPARRARIVVRNSDFGHVLFDANGQVVYVFENDRPNRSNCTSGDCVKAWPPVLTRQQPSAGGGVDAGLLGTIRRGDGRFQVTYNGRPLYFYEHETPGEIRCHNVDLHGGLWWVVTPRGNPAA
jgi:predicted lipoprotein with Yx(FWY)xxD motif